ncbi:MAG: sensor domain-containing diguanylate cyclase, partial [Chloroflexota bacterium]
VESDTSDLKPEDGRFYHRRKAPLRDAAGQIVGIVSVSRDITARKLAEEAVRQANTRLTNLVGKLERQGKEAQQLAEMSDLLQSCSSREEAYRVISRSCRQLFAGWSGALYVLNSSRNLLETAASWGAPSSSCDVFEPDECWGLRRGRVHTVTDPEGLLCQHMRRSPAGGSVCVPMVAQGDTLGVLYLESLSAGQGLAMGPADEVLSSGRHLVVDVAERLSLAVANLTLRETLRAQAIRDPLTGLFNRRYMEETLEREVPRALRKGAPLTVVMVDIDHFKNFNDVFGHDAGDALLHALGSFINSRVRAEDVACRYGGEEFTLILPEIGAEAACARLDEIREGVRQLNVEHHGLPLGPVTISMGVAFLPEHGRDSEALLHSADTALYRAKKEGRDRIVVA